MSKNTDFYMRWPFNKIRN